MPRGQKSKLQGRAKRRHDQNKAQSCRDGQQTATTAEAPPPSLQSLPVADSCSTPQKHQGTAPATTASAADSCSASGNNPTGQDKEKKSTYNTLIPTHSLDRELCGMIVLLEQFLLYKYKMKQPIFRADMLKLIKWSHLNKFDEILKKASEHIDAIFALEMKEGDSAFRSYDLVSKLKLPNNGRVRPGRGLPKTGLVMNILGMIFMKGNRATEEDIWKLLSMMGVYAGRKHFIYGEPRKLITRDLVRLQYLEYQQVPGTDPARYEFLWGPKSHAETSKMKVLEFVAKINDTVPAAFPSQYEDALRDEEESPNQTCSHTQQCCRS
ncbi:LOW QUALITY PROTEIN: melanoma-associated antigen B5-like [Lepus europaeus]|uniref:LOW QUALITY PROTEIN: melanoma-associated antigen B5-like n=1 Tax=Lepus europaeus TaxID=9983 RepID=UPI002B4A4FFA|nr:LOW QUALITY PROTEIN: melanoma-associated antigen B5-like [Lepus europaeus]